MVKLTHSGQRLIWDQAFVDELNEQHPRFLNFLCDQLARGRLQWEYTPESDQYRELSVAKIQERVSDFRVIDGKIVFEQQQPNPEPDGMRQEQPSPQEPTFQEGSVSSRKKRGSYNSTQRFRARKVLQRMLSGKEYPAKDAVDPNDFEKRFNETYKKMVDAGQLPPARAGPPSWSTVGRELGWKDAEQ